MRRGDLGFDLRDNCRGNNRVARRAAGNALVKPARKSILGPLESPVNAGQVRTSPFFSVREESLFAAGNAFAGTRTGPLGRIDLAAFLEYKHHYATVGGVRSITLLKASLVLFLGRLVEGRLFFLGENEDRIKLAATLKVAL